MTCVAAVVMTRNVMRVTVPFQSAMFASYAPKRSRFQPRFISAPVRFRDQPLVKSGLPVMIAPMLVMTDGSGTYTHRWMIEAGAWVIGVVGVWRIEAVAAPVIVHRRAVAPSLVFGSRATVAAVGMIVEVDEPSNSVVAVRPSGVSVALMSSCESVSRAWFA